MDLSRHKLNNFPPLYSQIRRSWKSAIAEQNLPSAQVLPCLDERYVLFRVIHKTINKAHHGLNRDGLLLSTIENGICFFQPQIKGPSTKFVGGSFIPFSCGRQSLYFLSFKSTSNAENIAKAPGMAPKIRVLTLTCSSLDKDQLIPVVLTCLQPDQVRPEPIPSTEASLANV